MNSNNSANSQPGFTLVEVLVSLVILSIGLLGISFLQITNLRATENSRFMSEAVHQATSLVEKMRSNRDGVAGGFYEAALVTGIDCATPPDNLCADSRFGPRTSCDAAQMAYFDIWNSSCIFLKLVPGGEFTIDQDGAYRVVTASWNQNELSGAGSTRSIKLKVFP